MGRARRTFAWSARADRYDCGCGASDGRRHGASRLLGSERPRAQRSVDLRGFLSGLSDEIGRGASARTTGAGPGRVPVTIGNLAPFALIQ
jgi:hypothetical protein